MHGFALNVLGDLAPFTQITPCGIAGVEMTSVEREGAPNQTVQEVGNRVAPLLARVLEGMLNSSP